MELQRPVKKRNANKKKCKPDTSVEPDAKQKKVEPFQKPDLVLVVENKELHFNSQILKNASPVFRAMLESDFREKKEGRVELKDQKYDDFVEVLKCISPDMQNKITVRNVFQLIPIADEYQMHLKNRCQKFLQNMLCNKNAIYKVPKGETTKDFETPGYGKKGFYYAYDKNVSIDIVMKAILAAEKYGMEGLLADAIKYTAARRFEILEQLPEYMEISLETRYKIMALRLRIIENSVENISSSSIPSVLHKGYN